MRAIGYNKEQDSAYDVSKLIRAPAGGNAAIEAFFTRKGNVVYAILRGGRDGASCGRCGIARAEERVARRREG